MFNAESYDETSIRTVNRYLQTTTFGDPFDPSTLITPRELQRTIKKIHSRRAAGPNKITALALKHFLRKNMTLLS